MVEDGFKDGMDLMKNLVVVRGGGDLATGIIHRIWRAGFKVVITEVPQPTAIRRTVSFAEAVYSKVTVVENVRAQLVSNDQQAYQILKMGFIPIIIDTKAQIINKIKPLAVVDAIIAKRNLGTQLTDAPIVIGIGPGFTVGQDVHAVIETKRGHHLGRVITSGTAASNTSIPGVIDGHASKRVLYAPASGSYKGCRQISDFVQADELVAFVGSSEIRANISGVLRGILHDGLTVETGTKVGDIDPRGVKEHCFTISDKARAVGGGVLEALMLFSDNSYTTDAHAMGRGSEKRLRGEVSEARGLFRSGW
ncbi:NAD(P)-binding Rossman fold domain protein [Desulfosporosinus sp. OT]|nr:NAD(P)-binding Rossman fold domain protein [Desulfosporosinus sp. OT]